MAFSFPVPAGDFSAALPIRTTKFSLREFNQVSGDGFGHRIVAEIAEPKWAAEITLANMSVPAARQVNAYLRRIGATGTFYLRDYDSLYPQNDPDGDILGSSTITINSLGSDGKSLKLQGFPSGYKLTWGDRFHVSFAGRRAYLEIADEVTVPGTGITPRLEVSPRLQTGMGVGQTANFIRPAALMQIESYSVAMGEMTFMSGASLSCIEVVA